MTLSSIFPKSKCFCKKKLWDKKERIEAGKMALRLRALSVLPDSQHPCGGSPLSATPVTGDALFWPPGAPQLHNAQAYIQAKHPQTYNKINLKKKDSKVV